MYHLPTPCSVNLMAFHNQSWKYLYHGNWPTVQLRALYLFLESQLLNIYQYTMPVTQGSYVKEGIVN